MMRLYQTIHADHEGGNVSAHATHLVRANARWGGLAGWAWDRAPALPGRARCEPLWLA